MNPTNTLLLIPAMLISLSAFAGQAEIVAVDAVKNGDSYRFDVTLRHADTGWDHYADGWEVMSVDGEVLGKRVLAHPHVNEQPFTRSLPGVKIPHATRSVFIRAHDSVHGYNKKTFEVELK